MTAPLSNQPNRQRVRLGRTRLWVSGQSPEELCRTSAVLPLRHACSSSVRVNRRCRVERKLFTSIKCRLKNYAMTGGGGHSMQAGHFLDEEFI